MLLTTESLRLSTLCLEMDLSPLLFKSGVSPSLSLRRKTLPSATGNLAVMRQLALLSKKKMRRSLLEASRVLMALGSVEESPS